MEAGKEYGIRHCGYYAMHAVRIEKVMKYTCSLIKISKVFLVHNLNSQSCLFQYVCLDFSFMPTGDMIWTANQRHMNAEEHSELEWKTKIT